MKRLFMFLASILLFFFISLPAYAEVQIGDTEIKLLSDSYNFVKYEWKARVYSTDDPRKAWIHVSLKDTNGLEITSTSEEITLVYGQNDILGSGTCTSDKWRKVKDHRISVNKTLSDSIDNVLTGMSESLRKVTTQKVERKEVKAAAPIKLPANMYITGTAEIFEKPGNDRRFKIGLIPPGRYITVDAKHGAFYRSQFKEGDYFWIHEGFLRPGQ